jgi:hypothetical protein
VSLAAATPKQIRELMKVDGLTNDEVKSHLQVCSSVTTFTDHLRSSEFKIFNLLTWLSTVAAEIPAAHAGSGVLGRRRRAGGDDPVGWAGAAVHDVAAQHVAIRVATGAATAHGVGHRRGQLRRRPGRRRWQVGELQLGDAAAWDQIIVVLN